MSIIAGNNHIANAKTSGNGVELSGSLLDPSYLYISGDTMDNAMGKGFSLQTGNQPSYYIPYSYIGSNVYYSTYPSIYTPPNYKTDNAIGLNDLFGFPQSSIQPSSKAYFLKYGNIVPTATENDAINNPSSPNYISYPYYQNYIANYPFKDDNYASKTTSTQSSLTLKDVTNEKTIKLDDWFQFELNSTSSYSAVLDASNGLYAFIAVQQFGSSQVSLFTQEQGSIFTDTLSGSDSSYKIFHITNTTNSLIQINLKSSTDSEVFIRVIKVDINEQTLNFDSAVETNHDFKISDYTYSSDPFRPIESIELHGYSFTVPNNLDGKLLSLKMTYRSYFSYSSNIFMYSEKTNQMISPNSNFIGHTGEKIDVFFTTVNFDAYYYSLKMVQSKTQAFSLNDKLDIFIKNNPAFSVNIPTEGLYEFYFEHNVQNSDYFYIYNSTGYYVTNFYGSGTGILYLPADTYTITFYGSDLAQFAINPKNQTGYGSGAYISFRSGALYQLNSVPSGSYSFDLTTISTNLNSEVYVQIYSANLKTTYLSTYVTFYSSIESIPFSIYNSGTVYFYIRPINIYPNADQNMYVNLTFNGNTVTPPPSNSQIIPASYIQPGTFNLTAGSSSQTIQVNMHDLTPKTWNLLKIQSNSMNLNSGFTLSISDNIIIYESYLNYFPDYSTRVENNNPEVIIGFGALSTNVQFSLTVSPSSYYSASSVQFTIQKMNTVELTVNSQQLGPVMSAANLDVNVNGFKPSGNSPGFEIYSLLFAFAIPVIIRKIKKNK